MDFINLPTNEPVEMLSNDNQRHLDGESERSLVERMPHGASFAMNIYNMNNRWQTLFNSPEVPAPQCDPANLDVIPESNDMFEQSLSPIVTNMFSMPTLWKNPWSSVLMDRILSERRKAPSCSSSSTNDSHPLLVDIEETSVQHHLTQILPIGFNLENFKTWIGDIPNLPCSLNLPFSRKVFFGGVPKHISIDILQKGVTGFGPLIVEPIQTVGSQRRTNGCFYVVFDSQRRLQEFLTSCSKTWNRLLYKMCLNGSKSYTVQVKPWAISNTREPQEIITSDLINTVFVGGLHGTITARTLSTIMEDLFGEVEYTELCTDKYCYPRGFAKLRFTHRASFLEAVQSKFIYIKSEFITKKVEIRPFTINPKLGLPDVNREVQ